MAKGSLINNDTTSTVYQTVDGYSSVIIYSKNLFATDDGALSATLSIVGNDFTNNETCSAKIFVRLKRQAGVVSIVGVPVHIVPIAASSDDGLLSASVVASLSGSNLIIRAIGVSDRTIDWIVSAETVAVLDDYSSASDPTDGQILVWSTANNRWEPSDPGLTLPIQVDNTDNSIIQARNSADTGYIHVLDTNDGYVYYGSDSAYTPALTADVLYFTANWFSQWIVGETSVLSCDPTSIYATHETNFCLSGGSYRLPDYGGGVGVMFIGEATTNPSGAITDGAVLFCDAGDGYLKYNKSDGTVITIGEGGGGGGSLLISPVVNVSSNITIQDGYYIMLVDTSAPRSITLPASPDEGRTFIIKDITGTADTNNITLTRAGSETIEGLSSDMVLQTYFGIWKFVADASGNWWRIS